VPDGSGSAIGSFGRPKPAVSSRFAAAETQPCERRSDFSSFARMINPVECAYETSGGKKALACEGRTDGRAPREKRRIEL
jgi:hypothetical protein